MMKNIKLSHLPADFPWQVHWYDTIDSTNTLAKHMAQQGAPHGTAVIANHQTGGRGRMGRSFSSPAGMGLYLSVILRPQCKADALMHLTCAAGVAACNAVETCCGIRPGVKWINDLIWKKRKLGGILTEMAVESKTGLVDFAVIGIGINCLQEPQDFPPELRDIAISLKAAGILTEISALAAALLMSLQEMSLKLHDSRSILETYRRDCITLGKKVSVLKGDGTLYGIALDVNEDGALQVQLPDTSVITVQSGEVSVRGMYGYI